MTKDQIREGVDNFLRNIYRARSVERTAFEQALCDLYWSPAAENMNLEEIRVYMFDHFDV